MKLKLRKKVINFLRSILPYWMEKDSLMGLKRNKENISRGIRRKISWRRELFRATKKTGGERQRLKEAIKDLKSSWIVFLQISTRECNTSA